MNTDEAIRILGETKLLTPLGQAAAVGIEAIKENARLRAERGALAKYLWAHDIDEDICRKNPNNCAYEQEPTKESCIECIINTIKREREQQP